MNWALVQKSAALASAVGRSITPALPSGSTAGNLLIAVLGSSGNAGWALPAGWVQAIDAANSGNSEVSIWYYPGNPGGISSVVCANRGSANLKGALAEFSTSMISPTVSLSAMGSGIAGPAATDPVTSAAGPAPGDLVIAVYHQRFVAASAITWTDPPGFTPIQQDIADAAHHHHYSAYQLSAAGGAPQTVTGTSSLASDNRFGWTGVIATFSATPATGAAGLVGAFNNPHVFGPGTSTAQAITHWTQLTGRPMTVRRVYCGATPATVTNDLVADAAAGRKVAISFRPAFSPPSAADAAALDAFLSSCKRAGVVMDVSLYPEAVTARMTAEETITATQFYAATVRRYYPLVFCTGSYGVMHRNENSYYAGDAYIDKIATDYYCSSYVGGDRLDRAASLADNASPPKPFGIWEFNVSADTAHGQTQAQGAAYFAYLRQYFLGRLAAGRSNADLIIFNSNAVLSQETAITSASDYRVGLFQALFDALNG